MARLGLPRYADREDSAHAGRSNATGNRHHPAPVIYLAIRLLQVGELASGPPRQGDAAPPRQVRC